MPDTPKQKLLAVAIASCTIWANSMSRTPSSKNQDTHPFHTWEVLRAIPGFAEMSEVAGSHHERLDGTGYFRGLSGPHLSIESRILAVADVFDALSAKRPYRDSLPVERVFRIMKKDAPHALDTSCVEALERGRFRTGLRLARRLQRSRRFRP